jgi:hypothetical protein
MQHHNMLRSAPRRRLQDTGLSGHPGVDSYEILNTNFGEFHFHALWRIRIANDSNVFRSMIRERL